jgi:hypothetical protein
MNDNGSGSRAARGNFSINGLVKPVGTIVETKLNEMPILTKAQLKNLSDHKYSAQGVSCLDHIFQPFWRWLVEQVPMNVAPNLITIIGLIINIITSSILFYYSPTAKEKVSFKSNQTLKIYNFYY